MRKERDPDGYRIYGLGEWGEIGGVILTNWEVREISQDLDDWEYLAIGQDFGFNHSNAILTIAYKDGDIYVLSEIYEFEKTTTEIIEIADKSKLSKEITMYCDSAEPDRIEEFRQAGYRATAVKKEKVTGTTYINSQIDWLKQRRIIIHPSCQNLVKELGQWKWKYDSKRAEYIDEPVPFFDDAIAALRYGVEAWRKPRAIKRRVQSFDRRY